MPNATDRASTSPDPSEPIRRPSEAWGFGLATTTRDGAFLDTWFPSPHLGHSTTDAEPSQELVDAVALSDDPTHARLQELRGVRTELVQIQIDELDDPPVTLPDAYLRLHLLSHRFVEPNTINLTGLFGVLANVVWTSLGPCPVPGFETTRSRLRAAGHHVTVYGVDKFPRMVDYVIPTGVRIADADRVRLGAHLAEGTTVMHEGFVNFNAGTLGTSMVEGRVTQGVVVEDGSDIGGGASIMGTLSGGGRELISIGKRCLIGANAGVGISLGDDCIVEAGTYITPGAKVRLPDGEIVKAVELSGTGRLLFWRNSITGGLEARPRNEAGFALNEALHSNA